MLPEPPMMKENSNEVSGENYGQCIGHGEQDTL
jgi:hypothetical protein